MLCGDGTETVQHFVMRLTRGALLNCLLARPDAVEAVNEMEGFADWLVDKVIKNCLDMMWRIRESVVGQLKVAAGQLMVAPSRGERTADLLSRQEMPRGMSADVMSRFRHHWSQWHTLTRCRVCNYIFRELD
jgi:hypothetical protein